MPAEPKVRRLKSTAILFSWLFLLPSEPASGAAQAPQFEPGECPFDGGEWLEDHDIECGEVVVLENRATEGSRTLRLAVAIFRSSSESPKPDPIVWLQGGPGGSTLRNMRAITRSRYWAKLREERDLVFFDQRGTGYSEPAFCPEMNAALNALTYKGLPLDERVRRKFAAMRECRDKVLAEGVDLSAYNSAASAQDLADLREALGYTEWNLIGGSYGTRLALTAMRDIPDGIRSAVVNAVSPPNANHWIHSWSNFDRSLRLMFEQCTADPACAEQFPNLEGEFYALLERLEEQPLTVEMTDTTKFPDGVVVLDGELMAAAFFQAFYDRDVIPFLPLVVQEVKAGNADVLAALADGLAPDPQRISLGYYFSVECYETAPFASQGELETARAQHPRLSKMGYYFTENADHGVCAAWHDYRASPEEGEAVTSPIPTLVLSGEFDPITPPWYAELAAETLPNSYRFEARAAGHGAPGIECIRGVTVAFLHDPVSRPDSACIDALPSVKFASDVFINGGVYRLGSQLQGRPNVSVIVWLGLTMLLLLTTLVWPLGYVVRRLRKRRGELTRGERAARWIATLAALVAIGFLGGLVAVILRVAAEDAIMLGFGVPGAAAPLFALPWVEILLTSVVIGLAWSAWRNGYWRKASRIHYTVVSLACISFLAFVFYWGLV